MALPSHPVVFVPLQVRFARPESEQARQRRIQSYEFLQKKQAEEPWIHLQYHSAKVGGALALLFPPRIKLLKYNCCTVLSCPVSGRSIIYLFCL